METIQGRTSLDLDLTGLQVRLTNYERIKLDLGTGDGKFAFRYAESFPNHFVIGLDSCRENLREFSRAKLPNLLYVIANAQSLPPELHGLISHVTINFPWGSLLEGLLTNDARLMLGLESVLGAGARIEVRLNGGAIAEAGWDFSEGVAQIRRNLEAAGWQFQKPDLMDSRALKKFPSTWAKRLAYGRNPRATVMKGYIK